MKTFLQINEPLRHEIILNNEGEFAIIQLKTINSNTDSILFESHKLRIPKHFFEGMYDYIKNGDLFALSIKRIEFMDLYKSFLIIFDSRRQIIFRTFNLIKKQIEEFHLKNIDTDEFCILFEYF